MPLRLSLRTRLRFPLDARGLLPDSLALKSHAELLAHPIRQGNRPVTLGEVFEIEGSCANDRTLLLQGDCSLVDHLGQELDGGLIRVEGNVGHECGAEMSAGTILVEGNAAHAAGAQMRGGMLLIRGDAGDNLGGVYPGSGRGQRGGRIFVFGNAGHCTGQFQRRGLIVVAGDAGAESGRNQLAGTILIAGKVGPRCGWGQRRGTIVLRDPANRAMLPPGRFVAGYRGRPVALHALERSIRKSLEEFAGECPTALKNPCGEIELYHGDFLELDRGEVWIALAAPE